MTNEQILAEIKKNKGLRDAIIAMVPSTDEGKELLANHATSILDPKIKEAVDKNTSDIYQRIDDDIFEVTGIRKVHGQKTYEFLKKGVLSDFKKLKEEAGKSGDVEKVKELEDKIQELTKNGADGKYWKEAHETAVSGFEAKEKDYKDQLETLREGSRSSIVMNDLVMGSSGLKFNPTYSEDVINTLKEKAISEAAMNAKLVDGKVVYHKPDGQVWLNEGFKAITAKGILATSLSSILATDAAAGGAAPEGVSGRIVSIGEGDNAKSKLQLDKTKYNTQLQFLNLAEETLIAQGIEKHSKEWHELQTEAWKENEVDKLEKD